jgi:amino acid adenylation domain-containing protein
MLRLAQEESRRRFDLERGPLLRTLLVRLGPEDHVLTLTMHHIVSDGWSMTVLVREMAALYEAFAAGRPSPLPEPPIQYADFALWQRERLQGERLEESLAWWRERLAGLAPLEIPADRPRPPVQTYRGARRRLSLSAATAGRLQELGRGEGATPFMVLLALWDVLLFRYSGQTDLAVGSPVANRDRSEIEGVVGFFVNTVVLRTGLAGRPGFRELLGRVRETTLGAYAHGEIPFERLVERLQPERLRDRNPFFQVMCTLQNQPWPELRLGDLRLTPLELDTGIAKFDLTLTWIERAGAFEGVLEHSTDLFDGATAQRLLRHYLALARAALEEPERPVADLPLLGETELRQILVDWNRTAADYPREATVYELFHAQAQRTPDAPAIGLGGGSLTYRELDRRARALASHLRRLGVGPEVRAALCLERSPDLVVAMTAVLAAGGAYVPLDPAQPPERLAYMIEDAEVAAVLVNEALAPALPEGLAEQGVAVVRLDRIGEPEGAAARPGHPPAPESLAYVMYTSGSTGHPKGVSVTHRAILRLVIGTDYVRLGPGDRILHISNTAFDAATFEIWGALLNGGRVELLDRDAVFSPHLLAAELREKRISSLFLTTALFQQIVREVPDAFAPVRDVLFGGEACDPARVRQALAAGPQRLLHVYGPTEGTTFTTWHLVESVPEGAVTVPIGRPLANTRVYLLDAGRQPVPAGVPGELYAGGDGLARGYLGRPALTAERFVPDPCPGEAGGRLYRTGDLARWRPDGAIEFLGRIDQQVKIRGFRIEPGEIEAALLEHPAVALCAVLPREDRPGDRRLVAYVSPAVAPVAELRSFLSAKLPSYMVPAAFVALAGLPLNANGKVDRRALARLEAPEDEALAGPGEYVEPRTPVEQLLAGIYADLLGVERVGAHDSFFTLGGHSLQGMRLMAQVRDAFGVDLKVRHLFESPTVAGMAVAIARELVDLADEESVADAFSDVERELENV